MIYITGSARNPSQRQKTPEADSWAAWQGRFWQGYRWHFRIPAFLPDGGRGRYGIHC